MEMGLKPNILDDISKEVSLSLCSIPVRDLVAFPTRILTFSIALDRRSRYTLDLHLPHGHR